LVVLLGTSACAPEVVSQTPPSTFLTDRTPGCDGAGFCWENPLPTGQDLRGLWGSSANDVWATGIGVVLHYDGHDWRPLTVTRSDLYLNSVWGAAANDVWMVGRTENGQAVALHWDGHALSELDMTVSTTLKSVWGSGPDDVWVVGGSVVLHYDGHAFSLVRTLTAPGSYEAVAGSGPNDVWAAGDTLDHFNGTGWTTVRSFERTQGITRLAVFGPRDAWALAATQLWRWNGDAWSVAETLPEPAWALGGSGSSDLWLLGVNGYARHYDGATWSDAPSTFPSILWGSGPHDVWGVSNSGMLTHWDGTHWERRNGGPVAPFDSALRRVSIVRFTGDGPDDLWAVSTAGIALHHDGSGWRRSSTPFRLRDLTAIANGEAWALTDDGKIEHLHSGTWEELPPPPPSLAARPGSLWADGPSDVWLVGEGYMARFNGHEWALVLDEPPNHYYDFEDQAAPAPPAPPVREGRCASFDIAPQMAGGGCFPAALTTVWGSGPSDVWALGGAEILHWDGKQLSADVPDVYNAVGISGTGPYDVWVANEKRLLHFDGDDWTQIDCGADVDLEAISADRPAAAWAVGRGGTVVRAENGQCQAISTIDTGVLESVWAGRSDDVWIGGDNASILHRGKDTTAPW
jgi:hypothetical protein